MLQRFPPPKKRLFLDGEILNHCVVADISYLEKKKLKTSKWSWAWETSHSAHIMRVSVSNCGYCLFQKKKKPKQKSTASVCPEEAKAKDSQAAGQESPRPEGKKRRRHSHKVQMETVAGVKSEKVTTVSPPCVIQNTISWLRPLSFSLSPSCFSKTVDASGLLGVVRMTSWFLV